MNRIILGLLIAMGCTGTAVAQLNTAYGLDALASNTTGLYNSAFGLQALFLNTTGDFNTASGAYALYHNSIGGYNAASGGYALYYNTTGFYNAASGYSALEFNTTGYNNTASGFGALGSNTTGYYNTASGSSALLNNTTGYSNTASGNGALYYNKTGYYNTASGSQALRQNVAGNYNVASGYAALHSNTAGSNNIGVGQFAGYYPTTGSNNIEIGSKGVAADNAVIRIGTPGTQHATYLAGVRGVNVTGGVAVMVTATGQLGVVSSSRRYKEDIRSMGDTSDRLLKLHPVVFRYKKADEHGQKPKQYGLIAEEVATVMPELVVYNEKNQPETVAYQALVPLLLNELQREHNEVQKGQRRMYRMQAEIDELRRAH